MRLHYYNFRKRLFRNLPAAEHTLDLPEFDSKKLVLPSQLAYPSLDYHDWSSDKVEQVILRDGKAVGLAGSSRIPHPLAPSLYVLRCFNKGKGKLSKEVLQLQLETLLQVSTPDMFLYYKTVPEEWGVKAPMVSSISQGLALSTFVRANELCPSRDVQKQIKDLVKTLSTSIEEGGVARNTPNGPILEEFPGSKKYRSVLNGWLFGLIGLLEYVAANPHEAHQYVKTAYDSLVLHLPRFQRRYGHRYALGWSRLSGGEYPMLVCFQLAHIGHLLHSKEWTDLALDWSRFVHWPSAEKNFEAHGAKNRLQALCL